MMVSCPGSSIPDLGQWVTDWLTATLEFWHKEWLLTIEKAPWAMTDLLGHMTEPTSVLMNDPMTGPNGSHVWITLTHPTTDCMSDSISEKLWCQGSFAHLQCFLTASLLKVFLHGIILTIAENEYSPLLKVEEKKRWSLFTLEVWCQSYCWPASTCSSTDQSLLPPSSTTLFHQLTGTYSNRI